MRSISKIIRFFSLTTPRTIALLVLVLASFLTMNSVVTRDFSLTTRIATEEPSVDSEELELLRLMNNLRAESNAPELKMSKTLTQAAEWMAHDNASRNVLEHVDSLGRNPNVRVVAFGYPSANGVGENAGEVGATGQNIYDGYFASPGHKENMERALFRAVGIAREQGSNGLWYWVTDFGPTLDHELTTSEPTGTITPTTTISPFPTDLCVDGNLENGSVCFCNLNCRSKNCNLEADLPGGECVPRTTTLTPTTTPRVSTSPKPTRDPNDKCSNCNGGYVCYAGGIFPTCGGGDQLACGGGKAPINGSICSPVKFPGWACDACPEKKPKPLPTGACDVEKGKPLTCQCNDDLYSDVCRDGGYCIGDAETTDGERLKHCCGIGKRFCPSSKTCIGLGTPCSPIGTPKVSPAGGNSPTGGEGNNLEISVRFKLPGINSAEGGNDNPINKTRQATITLYNSSGNTVKTATGDVTFHSPDFSGSIQIPNVPAGNYSAKLKVNNSLPANIPGIITVQGQTTIPTRTVSSVVTGNLDGNDILDLRDYNILISCFGKKSCTNNFKTLSDLDDNGKINEKDLNILLRGMAIQPGD